MYEIDDKYDCAAQGIYRTIEFAEKETLRFIEIYKDFRLDNFSEWTEIDKTIDKRIHQLLSEVSNEREELLKLKNPQTKKKW